MSKIIEALEKETNPIVKVLLPEPVMFHKEKAIGFTAVLEKFGENIGFSVHVRPVLEGSQPGRHLWIFVFRNNHNPLQVQFGELEEIRQETLVIKPPARNSPFSHLRISRPTDEASEGMPVLGLDAKFISQTHLIPGSSPEGQKVGKDVATAVISGLENNMERISAIDPWRKFCFAKPTIHRATL